eukprot:14862127-Ditylum_brightwellii.AAC.1
MLVILLDINWEYIFCPHRPELTCIIKGLITPLDCVNAAISIYTNVFYLLLESANSSTILLLNCITQSCLYSIDLIKLSP